MRPPQRNFKRLAENHRAAVVFQLQDEPAAAIEEIRADVFQHAGEQLLLGAITKHARRDHLRERDAIVGYFVPALHVVAVGGHLQAPVVREGQGERLRLVGRVDGVIVVDGTQPGPGLHLQGHSVRIRFYFGVAVNQSDLLTIQEVGRVERAGLDSRLYGGVCRRAIAAKAQEQQGGDTGIAALLEKAVHRMQNNNTTKNPATTNE